MSAAKAAQSSGRLAGVGTMLRIDWVARRKIILGWVIGLMLVMAATIASLASLYDTQEEIDTYAQAAGLGNAMAAINGKVEGLDTLGGVIQNEFGFMASFLMPLLGIVLLAGATRQDEESGRLELLLAGRIARPAPLVAALVLAVTAIAVTAVGFALTIMVVGIEWSRAWLYAGALACLSLVFVGLAAIAAQLFKHSRAIYTACLLALAAAYVVRGVGDVKDWWITWLSPLGWMEKAAPFGAMSTWTLLIPLAVFVASVVVAGALASRRDLGGALLDSRPGPSRAGSFLRTTMGLATKLHLPGFLGWGAGSVILAAMMGALTQTFVDMLGEDEEIAALVGLTTDSIQTGILSITLSYTAVLTAGFTISAVGVMRAEEAEGRLEPRLAGTLGRLRWLASHGLVILLGAVLLQGLAAGTLALTTASATGSYEWTPETLQGGLAYLPGVLVFGAIALLLFGWRPRWGFIAWLVFAFATVVTFLGEALELPEGFMDVVPMTGIGNPPTDDIKYAVVACHVGLVVVLVILAAIGFRRRGIPQG